MRGEPPIYGGSNRCSRNIANNRCVADRRDADIEVILVAAAPSTTRIDKDETQIYVSTCNIEVILVAVAPSTTSTDKDETQIYGSTCNIEVILVAVAQSTTSTDKDETQIYGSTGHASSCNTSLQQVK